MKPFIFEQCLQERMVLNTILAIPTLTRRVHSMRVVHALSTTQHMLLALELPFKSGVFSASGKKMDTVIFSSVHADSKTASSFSSAVNLERACGSIVRSFSFAAMPNLNSLSEMRPIL